MDMPFAPSDDGLLARALSAGEQALRRGALVRARVLLRLALARAEQRHDAAGALCAHQLLGHVAFQDGGLDLAAHHHQTVLERSERLGLPLGVASASHNLGLVAAAAGDHARGVRLIAGAIAQYEALGHGAGAAVARANLERLAATQALHPRAGDEPR
jgi:hypothetical protein